MILRIKKLAVIEDAATDNVVNLIPVTEGPDGAAAFGVTNEGSSFQIENGQTYIDRTSPSLDVRVLRPSSADATTLEGFATNLTDVYIAALTLDGAFFFGDKQTTTGAGKIVTNETVTDNDIYAFTRNIEATTGFDPDTGIHQGGFWAGQNMLGGYVWGDADSSGVADGWATTTFTTESFTSGQQTLEAGTSEEVFSRKIYLPFEGQQITFSIDIDSRTGSYSTEQLELTFYDSSDSEISTTTQTYSSTGRKSVTADIPANTVTVESRVVLQASSATVTEVVSDPALRTATTATYTKY